MNMEGLNLSKDQIVMLKDFQLITEEQSSEACLEFLSRNNWDIIAASNIYISQGRDYYRSPPALEGFDHPAIQMSPSSSSKATTCLSGNIKTKAKQKFESMVKSAQKLLKKEPLDFSTLLRNSSQNLPNVLELPLGESIKVAGREKKILFVFIVNDLVNPRFYSEIVCSDISIAYFSEFCLAWGWNVNHSENEEIQRHIFVSQYPCIAAIKTKNSKPSVLGKLEGPMNLDMYTQFIDKIFSQSISPAEIQLEKERMLRKQQEEEFLEAERAWIESEKQKAALQKQKEEYVQNLREKVGEEPPESENTTLISIRLPSGERIHRRFLKSDSLELLNNYITLLDLGFSFEIVGSYPSKVLAPSSKTLESEDLCPKALVHIRELIE